MPDAAASPDPISIIRSRRFLVLLALAAVVGLAVSLAAWGFLELVHQVQVGVFRSPEGPRLRPRRANVAVTTPARPRTSTYHHIGAPWA